MLTELTRQQLCRGCGEEVVVTRQNSPGTRFRTRAYCGKTCFNTKRVEGSCVVPNCDKPKKGTHGYCSMHRERMRLGQDLLAPPAWQKGSHSHPTADGYIRCKTPFGWMPEHRWVMQQRIGRPLLAAETVHHVNGIRHDNRPENLELWIQRQPPGQRIEDRVGDALEVLQLYAPTYLKAQHRHPQMRLEAA